MSDYFTEWLGLLAFRDWALGQFALLAVAINGVWLLLYLWPAKFRVIGRVLFVAVGLGGFIYVITRG